MNYNEPMTTKFHLDIIDVIAGQQQEFRNLIKDEENYWLNGGEGTELVRFDHIREWEAKIVELKELKTHIIRLRNKGTLRKSPKAF